MDMCIFVVIFLFFVCIGVGLFVYLCASVCMHIHTDVLCFISVMRVSCTCHVSVMHMSCECHAHVM